MEFRPSIKSVMLSGIIAALVFGVLAFAINFTNVGSLSKLFSMIPGTGSMPSLDATQSALAAVGTGYMWANMACFTGLIPNLANIVAGIAASQSGTSGAALAPIITQQLTALYSSVLPATYFYYVFGIIGGFVGGIAFLRKESKLVDGLLAGIIPALVTLIVVVLIGSMAGAAIGSQLAGSGTPQAMQAAAASLFSMGGLDMVLIFLVTYACITAGCLAAVGLRLALEMHGSAAPAGKKKK